MENIPGPPGPGNIAAREQVSTPAILLMVTGALAAVYQLINLVMSLSGGGAGALPPELFEDPNLAQYQELFERLQASAGPMGIFFALLGVALGGLIFFGGMKMKNLESHGLAIAASIIAMIPCFSGCCCLIGLPAGIWALVVLNKPEVKAAFR
jgi:hypothetical protein